MAWKHRTVAQEWEIVGLSKSHSQAEIAAIVGVSKAVVGDVQRKYHITLRFGRSYSSAHFRYRWDERTWGLMIEELYSERKLGIYATAEALGISADTLLRRMAKLGIRTRPMGPRPGVKRGRYKLALPDCAAPKCPNRVGLKGAVYCARCRRSARRRQQLGAPKS